MEMTLVDDDTIISPVAVKPDAVSDMSMNLTPDVTTDMSTNVNVNDETKIIVCTIPKRRREPAKEPVSKRKRAKRRATLPPGPGFSKDDAIELCLSEPEETPTQKFDDNMVELSNFLGCEIGKFRVEAHVNENTRVIYIKEAHCLRVYLPDSAQDSADGPCGVKCLDISVRDVTHVKMNFYYQPHYISIRTSGELVDAQWTWQHYAPKMETASLPMQRLLFYLHNITHVELDLLKAKLTHIFGKSATYVRDEFEAASEVQQQTTRRITRSRTSSSRKMNNDVPANTPPEGLYVTFPAASTKGSITLTFDDVHKLTPRVFLNDRVVDFYLKYIFEMIIPPTKRDSFHFFNSFMYTKFRDNKCNHNYVQGWTTKIDIFSKKYIVFPLNENSHWSVIILCNAHLVGTHVYRPRAKTKKKSTQNKSGSVIVLHGLDEDKNIKAKESKNNDYDNIDDFRTEVDPSQSEKNSEQNSESKPDEETENKDVKETEADEDIIIDSQEVDDDKDDNEDADPKAIVVDDDINNIKEEKEEEDTSVFEGPHLLYLNSYTTAPVINIFPNIRKYLKHEWALKNNIQYRSLSQMFSHTSIPGIEARVPQQTNDYDCGIFMLEYVERFVKQPFQTVNMIRWFRPSTVIGKKRTEIRTILKELRESCTATNELEQKKNNNTLDIVTPNQEPEQHPPYEGMVNLIEAPHRPIVREKTSYSDYLKSANSNATS